MTDHLYQQLRECIDQYAIGFNQTESQIEIELLKKLCTPEEARMYMHLERSLMSVEAIAEKSGMKADEAASMLEKITKKGMTFPKTKNGIKYYAAAPFVHGIFENNTLMGEKNPEDNEVVKLIGLYMDGGFQGRGPSLRTIPINTRLGANPGSPVAPFDDVKRIIDSKEKIGLFPCSCVIKLKNFGHECDRIDEVCMGFDFYAEYLIEGLGVGRWITREEAFDVLKRVEEAGLVHQIGGDKRNIECICNCCPDCCGVLRKMKAAPDPANRAVTNHFVHLDAEACTLCETCIDRCPMDAISSDKDVVNVTPQRCIGCGLCTSTCPSQALTLRVKPKDQLQEFKPETYRFMRSSLDFEADVAGQ